MLVITTPIQTRETKLSMRWLLNRLHEQGVHIGHFGLQICKQIGYLSEKDCERRLNMEIVTIPELGFPQYRDIPRVAQKEGCVICSPTVALLTILVITADKQSKNDERLRELFFRINPEQKIEGNSLGFSLNIDSGVWSVGAMLEPSSAKPNSVSHVFEKR